MTADSSEANISSTAVQSTSTAAPSASAANPSASAADAVNEAIIEQKSEKLITKFVHCKTIRDLMKLTLWVNLDQEVREALLDIVKYAFNEVDIGHQWAVEWTKINDKLVLGNDNFGYFTQVKAMRNRDKDPELKEFNDWIKKKKLLAYTNLFIDVGDSTD